MLPCIDATIGFEHTTYNVNESTPPVQICMSILDGMFTAGKNIVVIIQTTNETAAGDFVTVGNEFLHRN